MLNVNKAAAAHQDENNRFLYEAEDLVFLEELTTQDRVKDFINNEKYDDVVKRESRVKVVPVKRSRRIKTIANEQIANTKMKFPWYQDVASRNGQLGYRIIYVCSSKWYKLPLPKQYDKVYGTSEALQELRQYHGKLGFQSLITAMYKLKMLSHAKQAFTKKMNEYIRSGILPPAVEELKAKKGHPMKMKRDKICPTLNKDAHNTTSMVTDGVKDAKKGLTKEVLEQAQRKG